MSSPTPSPAEQVAGIGRHPKWRLLPRLSFAAFLILLLAMAVVSLTMRPRHPLGLPDDPDARTAAAVLAGRITVETDALRWRAAVLGGEPAPHAATGIMNALVAVARPALEAAHRRHRDDPRALAALAALDLSTNAYERAAGRYRSAYEMAPHYGEARLGAGVALALEADRTPEPWQARSLRLEAIAQFAMVDSLDTEFPLALYDRALVLADVGRASEGAFYAARYLARDPEGPHAQAIMTAFAKR